jgi:hypothetical protein
MDLTTFISKLRDVPMANADDTPLIRLQIDVLGSFAPLQAGADELRPTWPFSLANVLADASGFNLFAS